MKNSLLIGFGLGLLAIFGAYLVEGGTFSSIIILPALLIVVGGTIATAISANGIQVLKKIYSLIKISMKANPALQVENLMVQIIHLSGIARRDGVLILENKLEEIDNRFVRKLFRLLVDGAEIETLQKVIESEVSQIEERHYANISIFTRMGGYSPTMGIIGTVLGLISTLAAAGSDPKVLIRNIATAFIATFWGIFLANILWLPTADKLKVLHNEEMRIYQLIADAITALGKGDTPSMIQARLLSYFPISEQGIISERVSAKVKEFVTH